jgi:hypothetical protein
MRHNDLTPEEAQIGWLIQSVGRHASAPDAEFLKRLRETTTSVFLEAHRQGASASQNGSNSSTQAVMITDHAAAESQAAVSTTIVPIRAVSASQIDVQIAAPHPSDASRTAAFANRVAQAVANRTPMQRLRAGMMLVTVVLLAFGFLPMSLFPSRGARLEVAFGNLARASSAEFEVRNGESSSVMLVAQSDHVGRWKIQHPSGNTEVFDGINAYFFNAKDNSLHFVNPDDSADNVRPDEKLLDRLNVVEDSVRIALMRQRPRTVIKNDGQLLLLYNYSQPNFDHNGTVDVEARVDAATNELMVMNTVFRDDNGRVNFQAEANVRSLNRTFAEDAFHFAPAEKFADVATVEEVQGNPIVDAPEESAVAYDTLVAGTTGVIAGPVQGQDLTAWKIHLGNPLLNKSGFGNSGLGNSELSDNDAMGGMGGGMGGSGGGLGGQSTGANPKTFTQAGQFNDRIELAMKDAAAGGAPQEPMPTEGNGNPSDFADQGLSATLAAGDEGKSPPSAPAPVAVPSKSTSRKAAVNAELDANWSRDTKDNASSPMGSVVRKKEQAESKSESAGPNAPRRETPAEQQAAGADSQKPGESWDDAKATKLTEEKIKNSGSAKSKKNDRRALGAKQQAEDLENIPSPNAASEDPKSPVPANVKSAAATTSPARTMLAPASVPAAGPVVERTRAQRMGKRPGSVPPPVLAEVGPKDEKANNKTVAKMPKAAVRSDPANKSASDEENDAPQPEPPKSDEARPSESKEMASGKKVTGKGEDGSEKSEASKKYSPRMARGMNSRNAIDEVKSTFKKALVDSNSDKQSAGNDNAPQKAGEDEDLTKSMQNSQPAPASTENNSKAGASKEGSPRSNAQAPIASDDAQPRGGAPKPATMNGSIKSGTPTPLGVGSADKRLVEGQPQAPPLSGDGSRQNPVSRAMQLNSPTSETPEQAPAEVEKITQERELGSEPQMTVANSNGQAVPGRSFMYEHRYPDNAQKGPANSRQRQRNPVQMAYGARTENIQNNGAYLGNSQNGNNDLNPNTVIFFRRRQAEPRSELRGGDVLSTLNEEHSLVRAKLANGADLVLGPQSEVTLHKPTSVQLHVGDLELNVPEGDQIELLGPLTEAKGPDSNSAEVGKRDVYSAQNRLSNGRNSRARFSAPPQIVTGRKIYRVENNQLRVLEETPQWLTDYHRSRSAPVSKAALPAPKPDAK